MLHSNFIHIAGYPFERGYQLGEKLKNEIHSFLHKFYALLNAEKKDKKKYKEKISKFLSYIKHELPNIHLEIEGLSKGADISLEDSYLLQIRREIMRIGTECSLYANYDEGGYPFIAQNIDLPGVMGDYPVLVKSEIFETGVTILQLTQAGLLGYLGMNNHGIAIGINMVNSPSWGIGIPCYLLVYELLKVRSINECLKQIETTKRASSRSFTITGNSKIINVEMCVNSHKAMEQSLILHTNHYIHPYFHKYNNQNKGYFSYQRLARLKDLCSSKNKDLNNIYRILSDHYFFPHSICSHTLGSIQGPRTVASVVMHPKKQQFYVAWGNPCKNSYIQYSMNDTEGKHG